MVRISEGESGPELHLTHCACRGDSAEPSRCRRGDLTSRRIDHLRITCTGITETDQVECISRFGTDYT